MAPAAGHDAPKQRLILDFHEALSCSLDLRTTIDTAFPLLTKLVPADHAALCISRCESVGGYDWATVDFPVDWFSTYGEMASHDFVRQAVARQPNLVLRDSEMLTRRELTENMMYQRSRDMRMPLEHVMSVMLDFNQSWHAGVTLYRGRCRPFSDADRSLLQGLSPTLANAVRNCKLFSDVSRVGSMLDSVLRQKGFEAVMMASNGAEVARTGGAAALIGRWFAPVDLDRSGLPIAVLDQLAAVMRREGHPGQAPPTLSRRSLSGLDLLITFVRLPEGAFPAVWAMVLQENHLLPEEWRELLTSREREIAWRIILGWDNRLIADDVRCSVGTVKVHNKHIFDKLGVSSRAALCRRAQQNQQK